MIMRARRFARLAIVPAILAAAFPLTALRADAAQVNNVAGSCVFTSPDTQCSYTSIGGSENIITVGNTSAPTVVGGLVGGPLSPPLPAVCTILGIVPSTTIGPITVGLVTINQIIIGGATVGPVWLCQVNQGVGIAIEIDAPGAVLGVATPI
jgi:hypothetical protein